MKYIKFFNDITLDQIPLVGGKNAALGQMIRDLSGKISIPNGFAITVDGYRACIKNIDFNHLKTGVEIRAAILAQPLPEDLEKEIQDAYKSLGGSVAVRSSATAEDLPTASFAGQQDSFLHINTLEDLLESIKKCMASLFNDRAIAYRQEKGFSHKDIGISVGVQKMVNSDNATSGVMFTLETESGHPSFVTINAAYGLGETIVGGTVNPDEYMVHKDRLRAGFAPLVKKECGDKKIYAAYNNTTKRVEMRDVAAYKQKQFALTDTEIFELARYALVIEDYFTKRNGAWTPMDIEWAQDSIDKKLYIVQARPETVHAQKSSHAIVYKLTLNQAPKVLISGLSIGRKIASGAVRIINSVHDAQSFKEGDILVTQMTDPDWVPLMKKAAAIITDRGGRTCHAAIVARELGVPAIIGTGNATTTLHNGQLVTVDCSNGSQGYVYADKIAFTTQEISVTAHKTGFDLLVNIADPDRACDVALLPIDGAGLVRLEFIIAQRIGIHPMAIIFPEKVPNLLENKAVQEKIARYVSLQEFYIAELSQNIGLIVAALYPRTAVVRLTDFKSNEYRDLLGGDVFEPHEENPMLGFRGASRYVDARYAPAFELECKALKRVRETMGFENMVIMVPFVRTVQEAKNTVEILAKNGLERGKNGLKIYLMVEIPANVILFEQFAEYFDGFSIGSNDLTQLTLGVDRDSGILHNLFNENDPAVRALILQAIVKAHAAKKHISICGQAPSDYPDFAQWLIEQKIDALSLNPDAILPFLLKQS